MPDVRRSLGSNGVISSGTLSMPVQEVKEESTGTNKPATKKKEEPGAKAKASPRQNAPLAPSGSFTATKTLKRSDSLKPAGEQSTPSKWGLAHRTRKTLRRLTSYIHPVEDNKDFDVDHRLDQGGFIRTSWQEDRVKVIDAVVSFLPNAFRFTKLSDDVGLVNRFYGAVVFSDASGFTALTEQLAKKANGAELLSSCLNKFFTPLIDIITSFRGDVIKFSGDALTIVFEALDETEFSNFPCGTVGCSHSPYELACIRATACCLEIHKRLHNFHTGEGDVRLTLHIGVGAGHLTMLQVGGKMERYEYVISGTPLEQISIAEPLASSGETVLSPQAWEAVEAFFTRGPPLPKGSPPGFDRVGDVIKPNHTYPTIKDSSKKAAMQYQARMEDEEDFTQEDLYQQGKRFVPRAVLQHFEASTAANVNEMRNVTVIFVQITGVKVYTDEGIPIAQKLMMAMQQAAYLAEGALNKFLVDDKGLLFLLVFGLSPLVHIDDPERAIKACFSMIESLKKMKLDGRFGVTTGRVFCGVVGAKTRREYTVMGDTVNLSARLMANTKSLTVLIDEATYERVKKTINCEIMEPIFVKGKKNAIPIFRPYNPEERVPRADELFKRKLSWGLASTGLDGFSPARLNWRACTSYFGGRSLLDKVERWRGYALEKEVDLEKGGVLIVTGPSGIGKVEFAELLIKRSLELNFSFACGTTWCLEEEPNRTVCELIESLFNNLLVTKKCSISQWVKESPRDSELLEALGMGQKEKKDDINDEVMAEHKILALSQDLAYRLIAEVTNFRPLFITMRQGYGTTLYLAEAPQRMFWSMAKYLIKRCVTHPEIEQKRRKPVFIQIVSRELKEQIPDLPKGAHFIMQPMVNASARELMWHCLTNHLKDPLPYKEDNVISKSLQSFVHGISLNYPDYIQETVAGLIKDKSVTVSENCVITVNEDLFKLDIAKWVQTKMVGGVQSKIEALGPIKLQLIKMATCFEGPFNAIDLISIDFGKGCNNKVRVYDQLQMVLACEQLCTQGLLVRFEYKGPCRDRYSRSVPRWTISNFLYRKITQSMVLQSQRLYIKRCVLMSRALNVELPMRMRKKRRDKQAIHKDESESDNFDTDREDSNPEMGEESESDEEESMTMEESSSDGETMKIIEDCASPRSSKVSRIFARSSSIVANEQEYLNEALLRAISLGSFHYISQLLYQKADANAYDSRDTYALHFAVMSGNLNVVRLLISNKADIHTKTENGTGALVLAAQYNHLHIVHHFVDTLNALMNEGGRISYQEVHGVDVLNPSFWETRLTPIRRLREIPIPMRPCYITRDPKKVRYFSVWRRKTRHTIKTRIRSEFNQRTDTCRRTCVFEEEKGSQENHRTQSSEALGETIDVGPKKYTYAQYSRWMKNIVRGRHVTYFMLITLFLALYLPDVWIISHLPTNDVLDAIMVAVMASFGVECVLIWSCDAQYRCSFFFWMDFIGTISCLFDMSFFPLGPNSDKPMEEFGSDAGADLISRYARTGKLAARAGRIARLARLLKFLPGVKMHDDEKTTVGATSALLGREISKRVALLTIFVVAVLPLFAFGTFPADDKGLLSWLDVLERHTNNHIDGLATKAFLTETFQDFGGFFFVQTYGPFDVCIGQEIPEGSETKFVCDTNLEDVYSTWNETRKADAPDFKAPNERAALLVMTSSTGQKKVNPQHRQIRAWFDFSRASELDAIGSVILMTFTIFIMCGITLALSTSVNDIAVKPIQRILDGIRQSAKRIFSSVNALQDPDAADEAEEDNEILLLEEMVKKIARLSDLISKKNPWGDLSNLESEERGYLALADVNTTDDASGLICSLNEKLDDPQMLESREAVARLALENELRISWAKFDSWEFSVLEYNSTEQSRAASWIVFNHVGLRGLGRIGSSEAIVNGFIENVREQYLNNSYHNWSHACDVAHAVARILNLSGTEITLVEPWEQYALLASALCHDIGHPGVNNPFLVETNHDFALRYNDKSPLENMHCCKMFETASKPEFNIFQNFSRLEYKEIRKVCIATILHTDIIQHFVMVKELSLVYQLKKDVIAECFFNPETLQTTGLGTVFENVDRMLVLKLILHLSDISNPMKPWKICSTWAMKIIEEFFGQGAQEAALGLPVQILNDREKVNKAHSQVGFIEFICVPCLTNAMQLLPFLCELGSNCSSNLRSWEKQWKQGETRDPEEQQQLEERITKSCAQLEASMNTWKVRSLNAEERKKMQPTKISPKV